MKKILATILAISLILSTFVIGTGSVVSAATPADSYTYTLDDVGKTVHIPYAETDYDCVSNFGVANRLSNISELSIEQNGIDGSYAMTILGTGVTDVVILTMGPGVNQLQNGKTYIFELTAKSTGVVPNLRFGLRGGHKEFYGDWKLNANPNAISEWTTYRQEINNTSPKETPSSQTWEGFYIEWNVEAGEYLYIDNIKVYEKDDETKTNIFPNGTFEESTYYTGDKEAMVPHTLTDYDAHKQTGYKISSFSGVSITKEGVNDSYCLRSEGTGGLISPYIGLSPNTGFLTHGKTYVVSMKVRCEGVINNLQIGCIYSSVGGWSNGSGWYINDSKGKALSEWTTYTLDVNYSWANTSESTKAWDELNIAWKAPVGSVVFIDDIVIYDKADPSKKNIYPNGRFETATSYATELADDTPVDNYTYTANALKDYMLGPSTNTDGTLNYGEWDNGTGVADELAAITESGINGSYALELTSAEQKQYRVALRTHTSNGKLKANTTYVVRFKARVSEDEALDSFGIGLMPRWGWKTAQIGMRMATISADVGLTEIDTNWREYAFVVTTNSGYSGAWTFIYLEYSMLEGESLYIDDIEIYDAAGQNISTIGTFDVPAESFSNLGDADFRISPKYYGDWKVSNGNSAVPVDGFNAKVIRTDNAKSGDNVLALGFNDAEYNGRIWYELNAVRPGKTYVVEFWAMPVGDITAASISISDNDAYAPAEATDEVKAEYGTPEETTIFSIKADVKYAPRVWKKYTVEYTDTTTSATRHRWAGMNISVKGAAGSGLLIDSVSIKEVAEFGDEAPNLFKDANFEKVAAPAVTWTNTYYGTSATDYSFMNNLPKVLGVFGTGLEGDVERFKDVLAEDSDFGYLGLVIVDPVNIEVSRFEAKKSAAAGKDVWLSVNRLVSANGALRPDWQSRLDEFAAWIQNDIGDKFQGIYLDEPHLHFANNEEFITLTKYVRETYKKRVFSMTKHDMFGSAAVTLDAESHAYVTDVGYWNYEADGMQDRINGFSTAASKLDANVRKWICPLLGANEKAPTEADTMHIFNAMLDGAKTIPGFGGIMLYSFGDTNGYNLLNTNDEGVAQYNNYRNLLIAVSEDFDNEFASFDKNTAIINEENVIILDDLSTTVDAVKAMLGNYGIVIEDDAVATGTAVTVKALTSGAVRNYTVAMLDDVNGDSSVDIKDIIRMKKISAGNVNGTSAQYAAAGTTKAKGISSAELIAMKKTLLGIN